MFNNIKIILILDRHLDLNGIARDMINIKIGKMIKKTKNGKMIKKAKNGMMKKIITKRKMLKESLVFLKVLSILETRLLKHWTLLFLL